MAFSAQANLFFSKTNGGSDHGGIFDPGGCTFAADLACAGSGTSATPEVSSASYNFVAGDVGHWLFIAGSTASGHWIGGWYKIASVALNKATLTAGIGTATLYNSTTEWGSLNTAQGCCTQATPTSDGKWSIDYSRGADLAAAADMAAAGAGSTFSSATIGFGANHVGNALNVTAGTNCTVQRVNIISVAAGVATFDKAVTTGASADGTGTLGGAIDEPTTALIQAATTPLVAGNKIWFEKGTYTLPSAITAGTVASAVLPISVIGYNTVPGDDPAIGSGNQPIISFSTNSWTLANFWELWFLQLNIATTGTTYGLLGGTGGNLYYALRIIQTATGNGVNSGGSSRSVFCEASGGANPLYGGGSGSLFGCYIHDCTANGTGALVVMNCVIDTCGTNGMVAATNGLFVNNTILNCVTGLYSSSSSGMVIANNLFAYCNTPIRWDTRTDNNIFLGNNVFGCTNVESNVATSGRFAYHGRQTADPGFSVAKGTAGKWDVAPDKTFYEDAGNNFAGVATTDFLCVWSGTGAAIGIYAIASVVDDNSITLATNVAAGDLTTGNIVWCIVKGGTSSAFGIANALSGLGLPGVFPGCSARSYPDIGAVQRIGTAAGLGLTAANLRYGVTVDGVAGAIQMPNDASATGTEDATSDASVVSGRTYGSTPRTGSAAGGGGGRRSRARYHGV